MSEQEIVGNGAANSQAQPPAVECQKQAFELNWRKIEAMAELASEDETRMVICGVRVECQRHRQLYIATDGRLLGVLAVKEEVGDGVNDRRNVPGTAVTIPARVIQAVKVLSDQEGPGFEFDATGTVNVQYWRDREELVIGTPGVDAQCQEALRLHEPIINQRYPDWRQVWEGKWGTRGVLLLELNPDLMVRWGRFTRAMRWDKGAVRVYPNEQELEAHLVTMWKYPEFAGLWMPMREGYEEVWNPGGWPSAAWELVKPDKDKNQSPIADSQ